MIMTGSLLSSAMAIFLIVFRSPSHTMIAIGTVISATNLNASESYIKKKKTFILKMSRVSWYLLNIVKKGVLTGCLFFLFVFC